MGATAELLASLCFEVCPYRVPPWVKSIRRATHDEDHQGVDLVVEVDAGDPDGYYDTVKIQVKSGWKRAKVFQRDHPDIPVLVIHPEDSEEYVRMKLLALLRQERAKLMPGYDPRREKTKPLRASSRSTLGATLGERLGPRPFFRREP